MRIFAYILNVIISIANVLIEWLTLNKDGRSYLILIMRLR